MKQNNAMKILFKRNTIPVKRIVNDPKSTVPGFPLPLLSAMVPITGIVIATIKVLIAIARLTNK